MRTDRDHTFTQVEAQMTFLRGARGTGQHAQLIGGEVSLLDADDHAHTLEVMLRHGRKPMSMTHGDFDDTYLRRLALDAEDRPRFDVLRMAGHFDSLMLGRRGVPRPRPEHDLDAPRRHFVEMFERLQAEHGVRFDLAHNMTVTPANLAEVAKVTRTVMGLRYGMASFQPAAHVGNPKRWREDYRGVGIDEVWAQIEAGRARGCRGRICRWAIRAATARPTGWLPAAAGSTLLDDRNPRDLRARDRFLAAFGRMDFERPRLARALALLRVTANHPGIVPQAAGWALRFARRVGVRRLLTGRPRALTFVVHAFMDASVVRPAWEATERGEVAVDPEVRAAQERLRACSYAMAHPEQGRTVPACVQHSIMDPAENLDLLELLPMHPGT